MFANRRPISTILILALAVAGVASQLHSHGLFSGSPQRLTQTRESTRGFQPHECLGCKLSHYTFSAPRSEPSPVRVIEPRGKLLETLAGHVLDSCLSSEAPRGPPQIVFS